MNFEYPPTQCFLFFFTSADVGGITITNQATPEGHFETKLVSIPRSFTSFFSVIPRYPGQVTTKEEKNRQAKVGVKVQNIGYIF